MKKLFFLIATLLIVLFSAPCSIRAQGYDSVVVNSIKWLNNNTYFDVGINVNLTATNLTGVVGVSYPSPGYFNPGGVVASGQMNLYPGPVTLNSGCLLIARPNRYPQIVWMAVVQGLDRTPANQLVYQQIVQLEVFVINDSASLSQTLIPFKPFNGGDTLWVVNTGHIDPALYNGGQDFGFVRLTGGIYVPGIAGNCGGVLDATTSTKVIVEGDQVIWGPEDVLAIGPNPATIDQAITIHNQAEDLEWEVMSLSGQVVATGQGSQVPTTNLTPGVYVLRAWGDGGLFQAQKKILVQRE